MDQRNCIRAKQLYRLEQIPPPLTEALELASGLEESTGLRARATELLLDAGMGLEKIPEPLRESFFKQVWRTQQLQSAYSKIAQALQHAGVEHIPLKGIWMNHRLHSNPSLRYCSDLDLWVQKKNIRKAKEVMRSLDFQEANRAHNWLHFHHAFLPKETGPMVELHSALSIPDFTRIPSNEVWKRSHSLGEGLARELSTEDQLVYIFYHSALHLFDRPSRFLDLTDIWQWAENRGVKTDTLLPLATSWQCRKLFLLSLGACGWMMERELLGDAAEVEARKLFVGLFGDDSPRKVLRARFADSPWPLIRGILHPQRILGGLLDRLETR